MIKIKEVEVMNFKGAFRGMRNPLESWEKSDSLFGIATTKEFVSIRYDFEDFLPEITNAGEEEIEKLRDWYWDNGVLKCEENALEYALLGPIDLGLARKLILAGSDHSKFMRQITVSMDITAPLYW